MSMDQTAQFLTALYQGIDTGYVEIRCLPEGGGRPKRMYRQMPMGEVKQEGLERLLETNQSGYHIYHRIAISSEASDKKDVITQVPALWVDIDDSSDDAKARIYDFELPPTILLHSGGGYHGYWLLTEPVIIDSPDMIERVERVMHGLARLVGADEKCRNINRIMRTPGYTNIKEKYADPKPQCRIIYQDDDRFQFTSLERFYSWAAPMPQAQVQRTINPNAFDRNLPRWVNDYLQTGAMVGDRNHRLYAAARCYLDAGLSKADAIDALLPRGQADGLSESEVLTTIYSAFNNTPNPQLPRHMQARMAAADRQMRRVG